jgi:hypothetical protein
VPLHHTGNNRQAQAGSLGFGAEQRLKDLIGNFWRDADAIVSDRQRPRLVATSPGGYDDRPAAARRHGLHPILDQIDQYLPELIFVELRYRHVVGDLVADAYAVPLRHQAQRLVDEWA